MLVLCLVIVKHRKVLKSWGGGGGGRGGILPWPKRTMYKAFSGAGKKKEKFI